MSSRSSTAPILASSAAYSGLLPLAPVRAERAPPALVPLVMIFSGSPGIRARFLRSQRMPAFMSTANAGALPTLRPVSFCWAMVLEPSKNSVFRWPEVRPRTPMHATT